MNIFLVELKNSLNKIEDNKLEWYIKYNPFFWIGYLIQISKMIEKNIFESAKFGDKFVTRDGTIVIYQTCIDGWHFVFSSIASWSVDSDGYIATEHVEYVEDIVSRYQEQIDEEKLDELAYDECIKIKQKGFIDDDIYTLERGFKAGYRKAMNR